MSLEQEFTEWFKKLSDLRKMHHIYNQHTSNCVCGYCIVSWQETYEKMIDFWNTKPVFVFTYLIRLGGYKLSSCKDEILKAFQSFSKEECIFVLSQIKDASIELLELLIKQRPELLDTIYNQKIFSTQRTRTIIEDLFEIFPYKKEYLTKNKILYNLKEIIKHSPDVPKIMVSKRNFIVYISSDMLNEQAVKNIYKIGKIKNARYVSAFLEAQQMIQNGYYYLFDIVFPFRTLDFILEVASQQDETKLPPPKFFEDVESYHNFINALKEAKNANTQRTQRTSFNIQQT